MWTRNKTVAELVERSVVDMMYARMACVQSHGFRTQFRLEWSRRCTFVCIVQCMSSRGVTGGLQRPESGVQEPQWWLSSGGR